ncbi:MAG: hypothetical protein WC966_01125 [Bradymonadales bacterium]
MQIPLHDSMQFQSPWGDGSVEILGVHLHRYLLPLLSDHKISQVFVLVGFEASYMPGVCMRVTQFGSELADFAVDYQGLVREARQQEQLDTVLAKTMGERELYVLPVLSISEPGREHIHAFVMNESASGFKSDVLVVALRTRINEAIRAFRHNSLRMLFDDSENMAVKDFLERVLEYVPLWCGADHSVSLILSSSLEAMVMSPTGDVQFEIVSEQLFVKPDKEKDYDKLTSLQFYVNKDQSAGLLGCAFEETRRAKSAALNIFIADNDSNAWFSMGETQEPVYRFSTNANRPKEQLTVLIPLLAHNEMSENELMGFLSINFFEPMPLSSLASRVLETLAARLGAYLRRSSFFTLYAQQLWLIESVREQQLAVERLFRKSEESADLHTVLALFIERINKLIASTTQAPCFAVAYKTLDKHGDEVLRFVNPHGFTHFNDIDLPIHSSDKRSSLSTLAVRLNRCITLTGGKLSDGSTVFDSELYVNETLGKIVDARVSSEAKEAGWRPLSDYFMPSREGSYSAIAYPIRMKDDVAGVIIVEVDHDTNWIWWKGYSSYLFYRLLANEIAADFALLGLDVEN